MVLLKALQGQEPCFVHYGEKRGPLLQVLVEPTFSLELQ